MTQPIYPENTESGNFAIAGADADIQLAKKGDAGALTITSDRWRYKPI